MSFANRRNVLAGLTMGAGGLLKAYLSPDQQLTQVLRKQKAPIVPV